MFKFNITPKGVTEPFQMLDDTTGCESGCNTMSNDGDMVIATREGVWFFKPEGKGECFAFEGKKVMVSWFRTYLVVISIDFNRSNNIQQIITIYDLKNKYIAYRFASDKVQVLHIIQEWGSLFIMAKEHKSSVAQRLSSVVSPAESSSNSPSSPTSPLNFMQVMYLLEEKDTPTKLETLLQKNLYTTAINLVNNQQLDYSYLVDIFRKYGDHLYQKKDYDGAMNQYLRTIGIGRLEPSYVIRKFLDAQRIHNLTLYLEALHKNNLANSEHTTLLLNCYTKLKEKGGDNRLVSQKLDDFIRTQSTLKYDVETAIRVCRQAGYREHALFLARKHYEHGWFIKILIEDFPELETVSEASSSASPSWQRFANYRKALRHIEHLNLAQAEHFMKQYGKILVTKIPKEATNVLIRLCTHYYPIPLQENNRQCLVDVGMLKEHVRTSTDTLIQNKQRQLEKLIATQMKRGKSTGRARSSSIDADGESKVWRIITGGMTGLTARGISGSSNVASSSVTATTTTPPSYAASSDVESNLRKATDRQSTTENVEMEKDQLERDIKDMQSLLHVINGESGGAVTIGESHDSLLDDVGLFSSHSTETTKASASRAQAKDFIHCFASQPYWLMIFLESVILRSPKSNPQPKIVYNTLIEAYLQSMTGDKHFSGEYVPKTFDATKFKFDAPPPSHIMLEDQVFMLHTPRTAMNGVASAAGPKSVDQVSGSASSGNSSGSNIDASSLDRKEKNKSQSASGDLVSAAGPLLQSSSSLIDINRNRYLQYDNYDIFVPVPSPPPTANSYREKVLDLLDNVEANYDAEHILVLVQSMNFKTGILKMYERLGLTHDIVQLYMEQKDYDNVIKACNKYGNLDPDMWIQVLSFFAQEAAAAEEEVETDGGRFEEHISKVLMKIEKHDLLPPLLVVQLLSKHRRTQLGTIKDYLVRKFQQEQQLISKDLQVIKEYQQESEKMRQEIHELQTSAKLFQLTTCSLCNSQLELPAVHFMCGHSYHGRCLIDTEMECPICMKKNREILATKRRFEESSMQHEQFFKQLTDKKTDGFSVVSEYLGRGIFKPLSVSQLDDIDEDFFDSVQDDHDDYHHDEDDDMIEDSDEYNRAMAAGLHRSQMSMVDDILHGSDMFFKNFDRRLQSFKEQGTAAADDEHEYEDEDDNEEQEEDEAEQEEAAVEEENYGEQIADVEESNTTALPDVDDHMPYDDDDEGSDLDI